MTKFREVPGLDIRFLSLNTATTLPAPSGGTLRLNLSAADAPVYEGDNIISQAYIPSWSADANAFYRPGQIEVLPELLRPVAESAAFGGAGQLSLAENVPYFMDQLDIQSMVLTGKVKSISAAGVPPIRMMVGLAPEYHGVLAQPVTMVRNTINQMKTKTNELNWQVTLKTGSHIDIPVEHFDFDAQYHNLLVPAFGHLINDRLDSMFEYRWR